MACRLCGSADHSDDVCPAYNPSGEVEAVSIRARTRAHPASKPFRDCRAQLRLALSQREEDPARVWLELVSVRESAGKLPELAADDAILLQDIERFRAKLEAEIFSLTQEVGDEVLAPLYVWLDLIRRRNTLDREILVARQHVKEARAARLDTARAPRTHDESAAQLEEATQALAAWQKSAPPAPPDRALEVWQRGGWDERIGELPQDPEVARARGVAASALLATVPPGRPIGEVPFARGRAEIAALAAFGIAALAATPLAVLGVARGGGAGALALAGVAALAWALLAASVAAGVWLRKRAVRELEAAVDAVWYHELHARRTRALESETGWIRALLEAFRARRTFDESKAEGKQIEDLKRWRPDLRDFVVEVAKQGDDPRAAPKIDSLRPHS